MANLHSHELILHTLNSETVSLLDTISSPFSSGFAEAQLRCHISVLSTMGPGTFPKSTVIRVIRNSHVDFCWASENHVFEQIQKFSEIPGWDSNPPPTMCVTWTITTTTKSSFYFSAEIEDCTNLFEIFSQFVNRRAGIFSCIFNSNIVCMNDCV